MSLYEKLSSLKDIRNKGTDCKFNGYLEDYLELDDKHKDIFEKFYNINNSYKIIVGLCASVNEHSISNQLIRYKDIYKLNNKALYIPYLLYTKDDKNEYGIIMANNYFYSKAIYYVLTDTDDYNAYKNNFISLSFDQNEKIYKMIDGKNMGYLQTRVNSYYYHNYNDLNNEIKNLLSKVEDELDIEGIEKEDKVFNCVRDWFLLKKLAYVEYMRDKDILKNECMNNVKIQRANAKRIADDIHYIPYSELWKKAKD